MIESPLLGDIHLFNFVQEYLNKSLSWGKIIPDSNRLVLWNY